LKKAKILEAQRKALEKTFHKTVASNRPQNSKTARSGIIPKMTSKAAYKYINKPTELKPRPKDYTQPDQRSRNAEESNPIKAYLKNASTNKSTLPDNPTDKFLHSSHSVSMHSHNASGTDPFRGPQKSESSFFTRLGQKLKRMSADVDHFSIDHEELKTSRKENETKEQIHMYPISKCCIYP
jgi:hypothetical protein